MKNKLEEFFKHWKKMSDKGIVTPLSRTEIMILEIYTKWLEKK